MISDKVIDIAVNWWRQTLQQRVHHDNGDRSEVGIKASMIADEAAQQPKDTQLDSFCKELKLLMHKRRKDGNIQLYCDYGPGFLLYDAAKKAGISEFAFPWKIGISVESNAIVESMPYVEKRFIDRIVYCNKKYANDMLLSMEQSLKPYVDSFIEAIDRRINEACRYADIVNCAMIDIIDWRKFMEEAFVESDEYIRKVKLSVYI